MAPSDLDLALVPCARCRTRRVKCDRRKQGCERCAKVSQPCPGYTRERRFRDEGPNLRRKLATKHPHFQNPEGPERPERPERPEGPTHTGTSPGPSRTPCANNNNNNNNNADTPSQDHDFDDLYFDLDPAIYYAQEENSCGYIPNFQPPNPVSLSSASQSFVQPSTDSAPHSREAERLQDNHDDNWMLIRHFVDVISPWLDLFDVNKYFGHVVPIRALNSKLLKDSIAALAAKQLGNQIRDSSSSTAELEDQPRDSQPDWSYEAAVFYDRAIRHIIISLELIESLRDQPAPRNPRGQDWMRDLLAAVSIILLYESIDNEQPSMILHLTGVQHLLQYFLQRQQLNTLISIDAFHPSLQADFRQAWQASFWNFAYFDYITSFSSQSKPQINVTDISLWNASGLPMAQVEGQWVPHALLYRHGLETPSKMTETLACRSLIWVLLKALNYVAHHDTSANNRVNTCPDTHLESPRWDHIDQHLQDWYAALPESFEACLRTKPSAERTDSSAVKIHFPKLFYASPMGTIALLLYHFTHILVLLNRPVTGDNHGIQPRARRLQKHRHVSQQIDHHVKEICGIGLGPPQPAILMHMLQPLYLAGLCVDLREHQNMVDNFLTGLQRRTGCSTRWRIRQLREEWGWEVAS